MTRRTTFGVIICLELLLVILIIKLPRWRPAAVEPSLPADLTNHLLGIVNLLIVLPNS